MKKVKKAIYRSSHRGCRETDFILGDFAKEKIFSFETEKFSLYEKFIEEDDWNIYAWFGGQIPTPKKYQDLILEIKEFCNFKLSKI